MVLQMRLLIHFSSVVHLTISLTLGSPQSMNIHTSGGLLHPSNSTLPTNSSSEVGVKRPNFDCVGGADYGDIISLRSCRDAQNILLENLNPHEGRFISLKDRRGIGRAGKADVSLPYMALSSDGLCAIEITSDVDYIYDIATIGQFRRWTQDMITTCSINSDTVKGGIARNLGDFGNLGLILTKFDHQNIVCAGLGKPKLADCKALLNNMPATDYWQVFGSREDPDVQVPLPRAIREPNRNCYITVTTDGPPDKEKWYAIWKLSSAIVQLCVSASGKAGVAYDLGLNHRRIDIEVV